MCFRMERRMSHNLIIWPESKYKFRCFGFSCCCWCSSRFVSTTYFCWSQITTQLVICVCVCVAGSVFTSVFIVKQSIPLWFIHPIRRKRHVSQCQRELLYVFSFLLDIPHAVRVRVTQTFDEFFFLSFLYHSCCHIKVHWFQLSTRLKPFLDDK